MASRVSRNKTKFTLTKQFIFLVIFIIALVGSSIYFSLPNGSDKIYKSYAEVATETDVTLSKEHVFVGTTLNGLERKINNNKDEYLYVYYGMPSCSNCVANIETFNQAAKYFDVEKVYYLNATFIEKYDAENEDDAAKVDAMEAKVGFDLFDYPTLVVYKNGKVVFDSSTYKDESTQSMTVSWKNIAYFAFGGSF